MDKINKVCSRCGKNSVIEEFCRVDEPPTIHSSGAIYLTYTNYGRHKEYEGIIEGDQYDNRSYIGFEEV